MADESLYINSNSGLSYKWQTPIIQIKSTSIKIIATSYQHQHHSNIITSNHNVNGLDLSRSQGQGQNHYVTLTLEERSQRTLNIQILGCLTNGKPT
jgi:hypothetical protein